MNRSMNHGFRPSFDHLDRRDLPAVASGVTATLAGGILAVKGSSPVAPIQIDVMAQKFHGSLRGTVVVQGVGAFQASQVRAITVVRVTGEALVIHRKGPWSPPTFVTVKPVTPAPKPTPKPIPIPTPVRVPTPSPTP